MSRKQQRQQPGQAYPYHQRSDPKDLRYQHTRHGIPSEIVPAGRARHNEKSDNLLSLPALSPPPPHLAMVDLPTISDSDKALDDVIQESIKVLKETIPGTQHHMMMSPLSSRLGRSDLISPSTTITSREVSNYRGYE